MAILLDTSGLMCCLDRRDVNHPAAVANFDSTEFKVTHNYVLVEFVALAHARRIPRAMTLEFIANVTEAASVEVVWIEPTLHESALTLLRSQLDKGYSLCDAVSFLLMRERRIYEALTHDRHFEQAGFRRLLPG